jgi:flagellum-specific peptidoglycan hydrolase FlgJ
MIPENQQWLSNIAAEAEQGGHVFPKYAACEAALESAEKGLFGASTLALKGHNLFGEKYHQGSPFGELALPTKEFLQGQWVDQTAYWVNYPTFAACFKDRMATLVRLRHMYPHYDAALNATNGETYVQEVSQTWSTDPTRAAKVLQIYTEYFGS